MIETLKQGRRKLLRHFKMRPIHKVIRLLKKSGFSVMGNTLEVFGYNGEYHTMDYLENVTSLEIWEISKDCEGILRRNLPNATVKITDSYLEIKRADKHYDTIIIDNHQGIFGDGKCEHFEIIGDCFQKLNSKSVLIANVIPNPLKSKYYINKEIQDRHIQKRKDFYNHPTGAEINIHFLEDFYKRLAAAYNFKVSNVFFVKRNYLMTYVVLCLAKNQS